MRGIVVPQRFANIVVFDLVAQVVVLRVVPECRFPWELGVVGKSSANVGLTGGRGRRVVAAALSLTALGLAALVVVLVACVCLESLDTVVEEPVTLRVQLCFIVVSIGELLRDRDFAARDEFFEGFARATRSTDRIGETHERAPQAQLTVFELGNESELR